MSACQENVFTAIDYVFSAWVLWLYICHLFNCNVCCRQSSRCMCWCLALMYSEIHLASFAVWQRVSRTCSMSHTTAQYRDRKSLPKAWQMVSGVFLVMLLVRPVSWDINWNYCSVQTVKMIAVVVVLIILMFQFPSVLWAFDTVGWSTWGIHL